MSVVPSKEKLEEKSESNTKLAITLSKAAADHLNKYFIQQQKKGSRKILAFRISVVTHGCSNFAYKLEFDNEILLGDLVFESYGIKIIADQRSYAYIKGTELDYVRKGLNEGFQFNNPQAKTYCGCGESFNV